MNKNSASKLYEYRIRYNAGKEHSFLDNFHYYMAENAKQAFSFHDKTMTKKRLVHQDISIEKYNPYSERWEDESFILNDH